MSDGQQCGSPSEPEVLQYRREHAADIRWATRVAARALALVGALLTVGGLLCGSALVLVTPARHHVVASVGDLVVALLALGVGLTAVVGGVQVQQGSRSGGIVATVAAGMLTLGALALAAWWALDWIWYPDSQSMLMRVGVLGSELAVAGVMGMLAWIFWRTVWGQRSMT